MQNLNNLISICNIYKQGKYNLEEFQNRIITAAIPENLSKDFLTVLVRFDNQIEEIIFCHSETEHKKYGDKVANELIHATLLEQERLKTAKPYKQ